MIKTFSLAAACRHGRALACGAAAALLLASATAGACEAKARPRDASGPATSWVVTLNSEVAIAVRCSAMVEAIGRMATAGSALRVSIFSYGQQAGSRSLSLAHVAAVTEEIRSALLQKGRGQLRIQTVFGAADGDARSDPEGPGRIEIRVQSPPASVAG